MIILRYKMETLYFKQGRRYYPVYQLPNFSGFPANGIFLVDQGYTLVVDEETVKHSNINIVIKTVLVFHELNKILDTGISFVKNIENFKNLKAINYDIDESFKLHKDPDNYEFYVKKGTRYNKVAETFNSFETKGIYHVIDGKNNKVNKLNFIDEHLKIDFNKEHFKEDILEFIDGNSISYYDLTRKASEYIALGSFLNLC